MTWGPWELFIILAIVLVLFGGGKLAGVGKSLGSAVSEFKQAIKESDETDKEKPEAKKDA
ncbi:MAG TPA: twin-arginine translocase TatA/TatE family subunit [Candidatus Hydrogenedentes bacterium]|nr:twin-arginine translocase TatA/TatE family subunit [Candidatus Hydrogenedentota bacterium]HNT88666.1 twin-arginine translocase TatA/TatE family subunit [Candidatus Hydrogenedentota bacterium]